MIDKQPRQINCDYSTAASWGQVQRRTCWNLLDGVTCVLLHSSISCIDHHHSAESTVFGFTHANLMGPGTLGWVLHWRRRLRVGAALGRSGAVLTCEAQCHRPRVAVVVPWAQARGRHQGWVHYAAWESGSQVWQAARSRASLAAHTQAWPGVRELEWPGAPVRALPQVARPAVDGLGGCCWRLVAHRHAWQAVAASRRRPPQQSCRPLCHGHGRPRPRPQSQSAAVVPGCQPPQLHRACGTLAV